MALLCACADPRALRPRLAGLDASEIVDLTHPFDASTIYWPTDTEGFRLETLSEGFTERGYFYAAKRLSGAEHGGTHVDAPFHFFETGATLDEIPLDRLLGEGVVIDVTEACAEDRDYLVSVSDFESHEREHGRIPDGAVVLLRTGFGKHWPDRERYLATDARGPEAVAELHFPGLDPSAAAWLASERTIGAIGLDTPSIDHGPSTRFESHVTLFRHGIPAIENVAALDRLPARGFSVIVAPMKIRGGTGGPARVIAVLE